MRARDLRRAAHRRRRAHLDHLVAELEGQRAAGDEVDLLDLVVVVARALLEVRVRRDADQRQRDLFSAQLPRQTAEFARAVGALVVVGDVIGVDDRVLAHSREATRGSKVAPAMKVRLAYGAGGLEVELPEQRTTVVEPTYHAGAADEE